MERERIRAGVKVKSLIKGNGSYFPQISKKGALYRLAELRSFGHKIRPLKVAGRINTIYDSELDEILDYRY